MTAEIRNRILPRLLENANGAAKPRLAEVLLPEGMAEIDAPRSISLQIEFENPNLLAEWQKSHLNPILAELHQQLGEEGLTFPTVLKTIPL